MPRDQEARVAYRRNNKSYRLQELPEVVGWTGPPLNGVAGGVDDAATGYFSESSVADERALLSLHSGRSNSPYHPVPTHPASSHGGAEEHIPATWGRHSSPSLQPLVSHPCAPLTHTMPSYRGVHIDSSRGAHAAGAQGPMNFEPTSTGPPGSILNSYSADQAFSDGFRPIFPSPQDQSAQVRFAYTRLPPEILVHNVGKSLEMQAPSAWTSPPAPSSPLASDPLMHLMIDVDTVSPAMLLSRQKYVGNQPEEHDRPYATATEAAQHLRWDIPMRVRGDNDVPSIRNLGLDLAMMHVTVPSETRMPSALEDVQTLQPYTSDSFSEDQLFMDPPDPDYDIFILPNMDQQNLTESEGPGSLIIPPFDSVCPPDTVLNDIGYFNGTRSSIVLSTAPVNPLDISLDELVYLNLEEFDFGNGNDTGELVPLDSQLPFQDDTLYQPPDYGTSMLHDHGHSSTDRYAHH